MLLAGGVAGSNIRKGESIVYLGSCSGLQGKSLEVGAVTKLAQSEDQA